MSEKYVWRGVKKNQWVLLEDVLFKSFAKRRWVKIDLGKVILNTFKIQKGTCKGWPLHWRDNFRAKLTSQRYYVLHPRGRTNPSRQIKRFTLCDDDSCVIGSCLNHQRQHLLEAGRRETEGKFWRWNDVSHRRVLRAPFLIFHNRELVGWDDSSLEGWNTQIEQCWQRATVSSSSWEKIEFKYCSRIGWGRSSKCNARRIESTFRWMIDIFF